MVCEGAPLDFRIRRRSAQTSVPSPPAAEVGHQRLLRPESVQNMFPRAVVGSQRCGALHPEGTGPMKKRAYLPVAMALLAASVTAGVGLNQAKAAGNGGLPFITGGGHTQ